MEYNQKMIRWLGYMNETIIPVYPEWIKNSEWKSATDKLRQGKNIMVRTKEDDVSVG